VKWDHSKRIVKLVGVLYTCKYCDNTCDNTCDTLKNFIFRKPTHTESVWINITNSIYKYMYTMMCFPFVVVCAVVCFVVVCLFLFLCLSVVVGECSKRAGQTF